MNFIARVRYNSDTGKVTDLCGNEWEIKGNNMPPKDDYFGGKNAFSCNNNNNNSYVLLTKNVTIKDSKKFTVIYWMNSYANYRGYYIVFSDAYQCVFINRNTMQFVKGFYADCGQAANEVIGSITTDNGWHFYEYSYDNGINRLFYDGTLVASGYHDYSWNLSVNKLRFCGGWPHSDGSSASNIAMVDFCMFDDVLHTQNYTVPSYYYDLNKKALMISLSGLNFTNYNAVNSISVSGVEPENTKRRLAFKVGDKWNKLAVSNGAATLSALPTQTLTADSVLEEGNTVAEVVSATSIPDFAGKIVYPAIALYADSKASVMPTLGLKANVTTTTEKYTQEGYSQEYHLSDAPVSIVSLKADITAKGLASATVTVSLKNGDTWGDYIDLEKAISQKATDIKFKTIYTVTKTDGSESASLNSVTCTYTTSGSKVTNKAADVVTITKEFTNDLVYIHAYVKHKPLKEAKINVYAALRPTPKKRDMKQISTGSGETQTVKVDDVGINQDTLRLYYDGKAVYDFDYNTETSEITFKAAVGVVVSASYEYGWTAADWVQMTQGLTQNNDSGNDTTEYTYTVPAHKDALTVTAIRYELLRPTGHVSDNVIGIGTGTRQIIKLPHIAKKETIVCSGAWSYDYDSRLLTVVADKGTEIKISYDWIAEQPEVYAVGAGWADKEE